MKLYRIRLILEDLVREKTDHSYGLRHTFCKNLKVTLKSDNTNVSSENTLTIDEYKNALNLWIKTEEEILQRRTH